MRKIRPLIAVVDDEEAVRKALGRLLQASGHAVETFNGGAEFLASLTSQRPDCVVLDIHMPGVSGFDVLQQLAVTGVRLPVVILTGHDLPDAEARALRGGASAYLRKPVNDRVLLDAINTAIRHAAAHPHPNP